MQTLTNTMTGPARRRQMHGRDFLVAPVTMIVPGVLNGSRGPLYYPPEEVRKNPKAWNSVPLLLGHPENMGSGRDPAIIDKQGLGWLFNAKANGKLTGEAWFDVEATRRIDPALLRRLERGDRIELSTGLHMDPEPGVGNHNGKPYVAIARNYRPDHLAILPGMKGACSVDDGCGVNVNQRNQRQYFVANGGYFDYDDDDDDDRGPAMPVQNWREIAEADRARDRGETLAANTDADCGCHDDDTDDDDDGLSMPTENWSQWAIEDRERDRQEQRAKRGGL